jgi:hypothetical protein
MMVKLIVAVMISLSSLHLMAQSHLDILKICQGKQGNSQSSVKVITKDEAPLMVVDNGFCAEYLSRESEINLVNDIDHGIKSGPEISCPKEEITPKDKWKIRFYASHSFTQYFNTDITFKSSRYNVEIKNYEWVERSSREFFSPETWKEEGKNPFQMIDEPTNTFVLSIEKNGHEFFLSAFHPKFLQAENQVKHIIGNIDGVDVDEVAPVNRPFDGYNQSPGESELVRNQNTHKEMIFEIGYGHRFKLLDSKFGKIDYVPSVTMGVVVGQNLSVMIAKDEWWDFEDGLDSYGIQGIGGSITNRLEFSTPKKRFGVFYENKLGFYKMEHGFMDGSQKYNLGLMGNSLGMKFMINNPNNHKKNKL